MTTEIKHYYNLTGQWAKAHDLLIAPSAIASSWYEDATRKSCATTAEKVAKFFGSICLGILSMPFLLTATAINYVKREAILSYQEDYKAWQALMSEAGGGHDRIITELVQARIKAKDCPYKYISVQKCVTGGPNIKIFDWDGLKSSTSIQQLKTCGRGNLLYIAYPNCRASRQQMLKLYAETWNSNLTNDIPGGEQDKNSLAIKKYVLRSEEHKNLQPFAENLHTFWFDTHATYLMNCKERQRLIEVLTGKNGL